MITKEKFWIEDKGSCWDLYVYVRTVIITCSARLIAPES